MYVELETTTAPGQPPTGVDTAVVVGVCTVTSCFRDTSSCLAWLGFHDANKPTPRVTK